MNTQIANQIRLIRILSIIAAIAISLFIIARHFAVFGTYTMKYRFDSESNVISAFTPSGRASSLLKNLETGKTYQDITGEPVYMNVSVPRSFDSVDITMSYKNDDQSIIEFGAVASLEPWIVDLQPFEVAVIDDATREEWSRVENEDFILLQQNHTYSSIDQFLADIPQDKTVYTYNLDLSIEESILFPALPETELSDTLTTVGTYIQGPHRLRIAQSVDGPFTMELNDSAYAQSTGTIVLKNQGDIIEEFPFVNGKNTVFVPRLEKGVYTLELVIHSESTINRILSSTPYVVFERNIELFNPSFSTTQTRQLSISGGQVTFIANDLDSEQSIQLDNSVFDIKNDAPYTIYTEDTDNTFDRFTPIDAIIKMSTLSVLTDGYIAMDDAVYFHPTAQIAQITPRTSLSDAEYILYSKYISPSKNPSGKTQTIQYDLSTIAGDRKNIQFTLSAPGLAEQKSTIRVEEILFEFHRQPLWQRIIERVQ